MHSNSFLAKGSREQILFRSSIGHIWTLVFAAKQNPFAWKKKEKEIF
jgi:hypothetical protein